MSDWHHLRIILKKKAYVHSQFHLSNLNILCIFFSIADLSFERIKNYMYLTYICYLYKIIIKNEFSFCNGFLPYNNSVGKYCYQLSFFLVMLYFHDRITSLCITILNIMKYQMIIISVDRNRDVPRILFWGGPSHHEACYESRIQKLKNGTD